MNDPVHGTVLTQKYVTEFKCIGPECEDDCCHGWSVPIEKKAFLSLKNAYQNIGKDKNRFLSALKRVKQSKDDNYYGRLKIERGHPCPFLSPEGLCDVHQRFGPEKLGRTCMDYPRTTSMNYAQIEMAIGISCPEAARLCLLRPGSTELVKADLSLLNGTSGFIQKLPDEATLEPYIKLRNEIRQIMLMLVDAQQYHISGRLYLLVYFAHRIGNFFHHDTTSFSIEKLSREIEHIADPEVHSRLVNEFHAQPYNPTLSMSLIQAVLTFRADYHSEFIDFIQSCIGNYQSPHNKGLKETNPDALLELIRPYFERKERVERLYGESIDQYFDNYIRYYLFRNWYLKYPSLTTYLRSLLIQINIIKFLFFLNPLLDPVVALAENPDQETLDQNKKLLDQSIVQVCYQCGRGFEHLNPRLLEVMSQALDEEGISELGQLAMLAKS